MENQLATSPSADIVVAGGVALEVPSARSITIDDAAERQGDALIVELWLGRQQSEHTRRMYRGDAERFFRFTRCTLKRTTLVELSAYVRELETCKPPLADSSRRRMLGALRSLFKFAACDGVRYLAINCAAAIRLPRPRNRRAERILSEQQIADLIAASGDAAGGCDRDWFLIVLAYRTAARVEELVGLRWRDTARTGAGGVLTIFGKGRKTRFVHLGAEVWDLLEQRRPADGAPDDFIIQSRRRDKHGRRRGISESQAWRVVHAAAIRAGIKAAVSPHWLRHAHATHAIERGADLPTVQQTLGHESVTTTMEYVHCRPKHSSAAYLPPLAPPGR